MSSSPEMTPCTKLKSREIKEYREHELKKQKGICPLCKTEITPEEATLDHSYDNGRVRAVLHRSCNGAEGQIKKWAGQRSKGTCELEFVTNLIKYWSKEWTTNPLHPTWDRPKRKKKRTRSTKRSPSSKKTASTKRSKRRS